LQIMLQSCDLGLPQPSYLLVPLSGRFPSASALGCIILAAATLARRPKARWFQVDSPLRFSFCLRVIFSENRYSGKKTRADGEPFAMQRRPRSQGEQQMTTKHALFAGTALSILWLAVGAPIVAVAQQPNPAVAIAAPAIDSDDIGGIVTSRFGAEAGVWVVAETTELGTRFAKMVATDDFGRYVIPDLPKATYRVWVRGYGLVDSPKVATEPGKTLNLTAVIAPSLQAAAQYYPAIYWASMIRVPDRSQFPGTGAEGNGIPVNFKAQEQWLNMVKTNGCGNCH